MKILKIEGADEFHGAPKDWNGEVNGECAVLPTVKMSSNGVMFRVSQHEFTLDEIEAINNGATLYLWVSSLQHPVVSIGIEGVDYSKPEREKFDRPTYTVYDWEYYDEHNKRHFAGTPERAERLQLAGVKLKPVYVYD